MKKNVLFLTIALFAMFFASCDNNNEEEITLLEYSLKATPTSLTFAPKDAEAQVITVESENVTWSAMKEDVTADWLSIESSDNQVTVKVADNTETVERSSRIMIMPTNSESNVDEVYITVTQGAGEPLKPEPIQLKNVGAITYYTPNYLFNTNDNDEFLIELYTEETDVELSFVEFGKTGYWLGSFTSGNHLLLHLFNEHSDDFFNPCIKSGTYTACSDLSQLAPMNFVTSVRVMGNSWPDGSYIENRTINKNGITETEFIEIVDGKIDLTYDGTSNYEIHIELILQDGTEVVYEYAGELKLSNLGKAPYVTDLTENLTVGKDVFGQALLAGCYPLTNPEITQWDIQFIDKNMEALPHGTIGGFGHHVGLTLYSATSDGTDKLPAQEYVLFQPETALQENEPYTAMAGSYDPWIGKGGCYWELVSEDGEKFAPMTTGKITVKHLENDRYSFVIQAVDDNGHEITIEHEGELIKMIPQL